jgi:hypothetical protein
VRSCGLRKSGEALFLPCGTVCLLVATLRRSSHRATGRNREKVCLKQWDLEGSCLQLLRGVVVDGWLSAVSACRPKALQATPLQSIGETKPFSFSGGCRYDGRRRSADAELWRPCWPDVARREPGRSRERSPRGSREFHRLRGSEDSLSALYCHQNVTLLP